MKVKCPTCQKGVEWSSQSEFRPFCSKRCQMIDLGEWADEQHTIAGKPDVDPAMMSDEELDKLVQALNNNPPSH